MTRQPLQGQDPSSAPCFWQLGVDAHAALSSEEMIVCSQKLLLVRIEVATYVVFLTFMAFLEVVLICLQLADAVVQCLDPLLQIVRKQSRNVHLTTHSGQEGGLRLFLLFFRLTVLFRTLQRITAVSCTFVRSAGQMTATSNPPYLMICLTKMQVFCLLCIPPNDHKTL